MKKISRRRFIKQSLQGAGTICGALALGLPLNPIRQARAAEPEFPESHCGPSDENRPKILVAYASMYGTTGGVSQKIGETLCGLGYQADVKLVDRVDSISGYRAVIIGSAIRSEKWLPNAVDFVKTHRRNLKQLPTAYFLTCLTLYNNPPEKVRQMVRTFFNPVLETVPEVNPLDYGMFAGVLDYSRIPFSMRMVMKYKMWSKGVPEGDYRSWPAIESWAKQLASRFKSETV